MQGTAIIAHRLFNQKLATSDLTKPEEVVRFMTAMQAQEWAMAKWAIGLRLPGSTDTIIEEAYNEGKFLRTHLMRPTWHFVMPEDIVWLQKLTASRVHALNNLYYKKHGLDNAFIKKANRVITRELTKHQFLTRDELRDALSAMGMKGDGVWMAYLLMHAELECIICSGPRHGKQFTYALLEERAPNAKTLSPEEALYKLSSQYFQTRGPATVQDFAWWSGLTVKDCQRGIDMLDKGFLKEMNERATYIFPDRTLPDLKKKQTTFLLPDYDEYGISYKDRTMYRHPKMKSSPSSEYYHSLIVEGYFGGNWYRNTEKGKTVAIAQPHEFLNKTQLASVATAVKKYESFCR